MRKAKLMVAAAGLIAANAVLAAGSCRPMEFAEVKSLTMQQAKEYICDLQQQSDSRPGDVDLYVRCSEELRRVIRLKDGGLSMFPTAESCKKR